MMEVCCRFYGELIVNSRTYWEIRGILVEWDGLIELCCLGCWSDLNKPGDKG